MVKKDLLEEAKKRYPKGAKIKSKRGTREFSIKGTPFWYNNESILDFDESKCGNFYTLYDDKIKRWADIVSLPKNTIHGVTLEQGKDYYIQTFHNTHYVFKFNYMNDLNQLCVNYYIDVQDNSFTGGGNLSDVKSIKSIRQATKEESDHLEACIKAGKYVKMKGRREFVHCINQEQWNFVNEKLGYVWTRGSLFGKDTCVNINSKEYTSLECFNPLISNTLIYSFEDWCQKFNHQFEWKPKVGDWVFYKNEISQIINISKNGIAFEKGEWITLENKRTFHYESHKHELRKALPHEIPNNFIPDEVKPCCEISLPSLEDVIPVTKQKYKIEDGYLPYLEPVVNLSSILSLLNNQ